MDLSHVRCYMRPRIGNNISLAERAVPADSKRGEPVSCSFPKRSQAIGRRQVLGVPGEHWADSRRRSYIHVLPL